MSRSDLGWSPELAAALQALARADLTPARVVTEQRASYRIHHEASDVRATVSGRLRHDALDKTALPAVGDWVAVHAHAGHAVIHAVLPRRTALVRKLADKTAGAQVLAANVDTVFVVTSCNRDFNPRRVERYLAFVWESGAVPVVVLNKADLCDDVAALRAEAEAVSPGVDVHAISAAHGDGVEALAAHAGPGRTVALVGSSGVGKSTLTNRLLGEDIQVVQQIRAADGRGRHTTTHRELLLLPGGGALIDTPGLRELALVDAAAGVRSAFEDIESLARACRFTDCGHAQEPGCRVQAALADGALDEERYASWVKLQREEAFHARKADENLARAETLKWKKRTQEYRKRPRRGYR